MISSVTPAGSSESRGSGALAVWPIIRLPGYTTGATANGIGSGDGGPATRHGTAARANRFVHRARAGAVAGSAPAVLRPPPRIRPYRPGAWWRSHPRVGGAARRGDG